MNDSKAKIKTKTAPVTKTTTVSPSRPKYETPVVSKLGDRTPYGTGASAAGGYAPGNCCYP